MLAKTTEHSGFLLFAYLSINTLLSLSVWMLLLLPQHLAQNHWSSQRIGWAMGGFFLMNLLAQVFASTLAQRIGSVPTALVGIGLALTGGLFYLASLGALELVFVARLLHGVGTGLVSAGVLIHLLESVPPQLRGRTMGYYGLPGFVTLGAGPVLSQFLQSEWQLQATYWAIVLCFAMAGGVLLFLPRPLPLSKRRSRFLRAMRVNFPRLKSILVVSFFFGLCNSSWQSFLAPAVVDVGPEAVSAFGLGYGTGAIFFRLGWSKRLEREGWHLAAVSGLMVFGLMLSVLPHLNQPAWFVVVGALCGGVHGLYYPALSSTAAERFHPLVPGHGMSLYISAFSLGYFIGPPLWGAIADQFGYDWMFAAAGTFLMVPTLTFVVSEWRGTSRREGA